jgi:hypothetical protein
MFQRVPSGAAYVRRLGLAVLRLQQLGKVHRKVGAAAGQGYRHPTTMALKKVDQSSLLDKVGVSRSDA